MKSVCQAAALEPPSPRQQNELLTAPAAVAPWVLAGLQRAGQGAR